MAAKMTLSKMMQRAINQFWTLKIPGTQKITVESVHLFGTNIRSGTCTNTGTCRKEAEFTGNEHIHNSQMLNFILV